MTEDLKIKLLNSEKATQISTVEETRGNMEKRLELGRRILLLKWGG